MAIKMVFLLLVWVGLVVWLVHVWATDPERYTHPYHWHKLGIVLTGMVIMLLGGFFLSWLLGL